MSLSLIHFRKFNVAQKKKDLNFNAYLKEYVLAYKKIYKTINLNEHQGNEIPFKRRQKTTKRNNISYHIFPFTFLSKKQYNKQKIMILLEEKKNFSVAGMASLSVMNRIKRFFCCYICLC